MTELKSLIKKEFLPILEPYGFVHHKNNLVIKPINELLRGFCFDRHDNHLYIHLFVQPLFIPSRFLFLSYGWRLKGGHPLGDMFILTDEEIEYTKSEIAKLILAEKDVLLATKTPVDFYNKFLISDLKLLAYKTSINIRYQEAVTYTKSYINPEETCTLIDQFLIGWERDDRNQINWMQEIKANMLLLKQVCSSKERVDAQFKEWERFTVTNLRL